MTNSDEEPAERTPRQLLVFGQKTFKINIPADARVTFGPWSPPGAGEKSYQVTEKSLVGTLRVYAGKTETVLAVFSGVTGFRDLSIEYAEEVAREEGAIIWKSDQNGYEREEKVKRETTWAGGMLAPVEGDE